ncbi:FkbM family methyltransferase [Nostoc sp. PA-18-2419]|uniref:FkbM family methyltransferase n=1 Tax=Nostoc sp. PA-18-2419 TaxID=2575443 RepID=UPI001109590E|nr:FkbM family methyltransferase [Nostoc sp. PA-18-2419]
MGISSLIYKNCLRSSGLSYYFWLLLREIIIKLFHDPACVLTIHGRSLHVPLSHALPIYLKEYQFYDRLPARISNYIHDKYGYLKCIDVGANIGDSIAAFYNDIYTEDSFLAIEPNPNFKKYLLSNWQQIKNVKILSFICSYKSSIRAYTVIEKNGTASVINTEGSIKMETRSLDDIVTDNSEFKYFNILKIDTDGHDFEVISGGKEAIKDNFPTILFECDAFSNQNYVENCLETFNFFEKIGYNYFLVYDNFGYLMGKYPLSDLRSFQNLLFYQLTSKFYYFDILLMKDEDIKQFFELEVAYFIDKIPNNTLQHTVFKAAGAEF